MTHARRFRFGAEMMAPFEGATWAQSAQRLESLGYSTLFVPDHFHEGLGPITAMATAAMATTTLKVAPMVLNTDLRHPAVLARELADDVEVLIAANPCMGLDFAAVAEIHDRILAARNGGAAVLLVSEDLDELLALSDRILVIFDGRIVHETSAATADIGVIGPAMAGHDARARTA